MLAHCRLRGKEGKERGGEGEKRKGACQCYQAVGNSQAAGLGDEGSLRSFSCAFPGLCKMLGWVRNLQQIKGMVVRRDRSN